MSWSFGYFFFGVIIVLVVKGVGVVFSRGEVVKGNVSKGGIGSEYIGVRFK